MYDIHTIDPSEPCEHCSHEYREHTVVACNHDGCACIFFVGAPKNYEQPDHETL